MPATRRARGTTEAGWPRHAAMLRAQVQRASTAGGLRRRGENAA